MPLGVASMRPVEWENPHSSPLLCAWISRLYDLCLDGTIKRDKSTDNPTFTVTARAGDTEKSYGGCSIECVGGPFHRRSIILMDSKREIVIKEQYIEVDRRFEEGPILDIVHAHKTFPGVVRKESYNVVQADGKDLVVEDDGVKGNKSRLVMSDTGGRLMDAETPLDALIAFYDLLEVTRFLYTKRGVLHRDISPGNVLLRTKFPSGDSFSDDLGEMCIASFLLKEKFPNLAVTRLDTRLLLIDYDMSEDHNVVIKRVGKPLHGTGTPGFMARIVRSCEYQKGLHDLPPMPRLGEGKDRYQHCVGSRLAAFPDNNRELLDVEKNQIPPVFLHKLCYDAESVYWLLLYWCLLAKPKNDPISEEIPSNIWNALSSVNERRDDRDIYFISRFPNKICHSAYAPLDVLLGEMAAQLRGDLDFADETLGLATKVVPGDDATERSRCKDEYLHEAFQRLIFNFLFKYYDADFMKEKKSKGHREVEKDRRGTLPLSTKESETRSSRQLKRKREENETGDSSDDGGPKPKIPRTTPAP